MVEDRDFRPHGMTAKLMKASSRYHGAIMNTSRSASRGTMSSFSGSLSASAIGCSRPKGRPG